MKGLIFYPIYKVTNERCTLSWMQQKTQDNWVKELECLPHSKEQSTKYALPPCAACPTGVKGKGPGEAAQQQICHSAQDPEFENLPAQHTYLTSALEEGGIIFTMLDRRKIAS